jgi:alpha-mannosidase
VEKGALSGGRMSFALVSENMDLPVDASIEERELLQVFDSTVMIETIKRGEDGEALIVRLYETMGGAADVKLWVATPFETAQECDMLENPARALKVDRDGSVALRFRPFEVKTIRLG